jgi:hypothetical protein
MGSNLHHGFLLQELRFSCFLGQTSPSTQLTCRPSLPAFAVNIEYALAFLATASQS